MKDYYLERDNLRRKVEVAELQRELEYQTRLAAAEDKYKFHLDEVGNAEDALIEAVGKEKWEEYRRELGKRLESEAWIAYMQDAFGHCWDLFRAYWRAVDRLFEYVQMHKKERS